FKDAEQLIAGNMKYTFRFPLGCQNTCSGKVVHPGRHPPLVADHGDVFSCFKRVFYPTNNVGTCSFRNDTVNEYCPEYGGSAPRLENAAFRVQLALPISVARIRRVTLRVWTGCSIKNEVCRQEGEMDVVLLTILCYLFAEKDVDPFALFGLLFARFHACDCCRMDDVCRLKSLRSFHKSAEVGEVKRKKVGLFQGWIPVGALRHTQDRAAHVSLQHVG